MIDLHAHVLPGIDDGAQSLDEAIALCRVAQADGTRTIVATPHSGGREGRPIADRPTLAEVRARVTALQRELDARAIEIRLVPGMEVYVEADLLGQEERPVTLGGTRYLLLELPADLVPPGLDDLVFQLQVAGYVPILAHPERNLGIIRRPERLHELVTRGCLGQVTAASLAGGFGTVVQQTAELLLVCDLVHVIASDAHWYPERPTGLTEGVEHAARLVGAERAKAMAEAVPRAILDDAPVEGFRPRVPKPRRRWLPW